MSSIACLLIVFLSAGAEGEPQSVAVLPLVAKRVPQDTVAVLDELLLTSISQTGRYRALGLSDINALIGIEKMKEVLGCNDVSCAVELGGALGVDLLVTGSVSKLGGNVIVTLSLVDARAHLVKRRSKAQVANDENLYGQAIDTAVCQLLETHADCTTRSDGSGGVAAAPPPPALPAASHRGYTRYENGHAVVSDASRRWADAVADCIDAGKTSGQANVVACEFDGRSIGYELLWDGKRAGYAPGWDWEKARNNCAWNLANNPDKRVQCLFEGEPLDPAVASPPKPPSSGATGRGYELLFNGRLAKQATLSRAEAVRDCLATRERFGERLVVTCDFFATRLGYELFLDGAAVGYEPGWDLNQARSNCAWNVRTHAGTRVECRFEGKPIAPAEPRRWDVAEQFSTTANPNGPFAYGWVEALPGRFSAFDRVDAGVSGCAASIVDWHSNRKPQRPPVVAKNTTPSTTCNGIPPGAVNLHPGPNGELAVLRWTSPIAGKVRIDGRFGAGDAGVVSYFIYRDGADEIYALRRAAGDGPFSVTTAVAVGTTIDFLVGEGYAGGSTPLAAVIESAP